jgi:hypothetical protein
MPPATREHRVISALAAPVITAEFSWFASSQPVFQHAVDANPGRNRRDIPE